MTGEYQQEDPRTPTAWKRAAALHVELGLHPALSTVAGLKLVQKKLTETQFQAATQWAAMLDEYDVLVLGKCSRVKPPSYERRSPGESAERSQDHINAFLKRFRAARTALSVTGQIAEAAVTRLCREEGAPVHFDDISRGLSALAAHWGLTGKSKNAKRDK